MIRGLALIYLHLILAVTVHEVGHLLCAFAVGLPVSDIQIGWGKLLHQSCHRGIWLRVYLVPTSGRVRCCWLSKKEWKNLVLYAGGVLGNFVGALVMFSVDPDFSVMCLMMAFYNLVPKEDSDGQKLLVHYQRWREQNEDLRGDHGARGKSTPAGQEYS